MPEEAIPTGYSLSQLPTQVFHIHFHIQTILPIQRPLFPIAIMGGSGRKLIPICPPPPSIPHERPQEPNSYLKQWNSKQPPYWQ